MMTGGRMRGIRGSIVGLALLLATVGALAVAGARAGGCQRDANANGRVDIVDIMTTVIQPGCQGEIGAIAGRWRQPWPTATPTLPAIWRPALATSWQWQLSGLPVDQSVPATMYDLDLFETEASTVAALHAQGRRVVCYISVGSWEEWRPDAADFPAEVIGNDYEGWPGEKWLDIRRLDLLAPLMTARLDLCRAKGFDGVEPDNIDGYTNGTGFPLTAADQLRYNRWLAQAAHARGLSIGLKNDPEQVAELIDDFDWALTEDCFAQGWCDQLRPFVVAGKAVFAAEYTDTGITTADFCAQARTMQFNAILKHRDLDAWREACP